MTLQQFYVKVYNRMQSRKERKGQAFFNVLSEVRPALADRIRGTELDPYYQKDPNLFDFQQWLVLNW